MTSRRMYIMPDGRPLGAYLTDTETAKHVASSRRRRRNNSDLTEWDQAKRTISEAEQAQIDAAMRAGRSRRRRYFNDKLLRDMAGPLTHADMQALFKPVPFGEPGPASPFEQAVLLPVWDAFRSIEMDKQRRVLEAWEARAHDMHGSTQERAPAGDAGLRSSAAAAVRAWSRIDRRARHALKRAHFELVHALEVQMWHHLSTAGQQASLDVSDAFERLLTHGLAQYHGLHCKPAAQGSVFLAVKGASGRRPQHAAISCADVVLALESMPHGGLSAAALHEALCCEGNHEPDHQLER